MTEQTTESYWPTRRAQWFGLLAAPAAFLLVAVFTSFVAPAACQVGLLQMNAFGISLLSVLTFVITLAGLGVAVWGGIVAYRNRERTGQAGAPPDNNSRFLSVGGIMLSALFVLLTLIAGLSGLALQPCHPV